jgi:hypothetical protein
MSSVSRSEAAIEDEICELPAEEHNVINENPESTPFVVDTSILSSMYTNTGVSIEKLSQNHKVMLLFLRHTGMQFNLHNLHFKVVYFARKHYAIFVTCTMSCCSSTRS